ncbi:hypothetical protein GC093_20635 [Paenibacillus sp. LMG 31456]|uniref:Uncharacterized protein n=1 Tax=Paenibacillus foliorum TaxID=2654974 RepID=A0A972K455_9BACL|nr:hypothetical protein [Paenibacillus foliorum]NOU95617.1 hypothetical protein [Paenibacillus foliorum]
MQQKVDALRTLINELHEIKGRSFTHGALDMILWMDSKLELTAQLLNELSVELNSEYPDQQRILNRELEESVSI